MNNNNTLRAEEWLSAHNFIGKPFEDFVAEREKDLPKYFCGLQFLDELRSPKHLFLFGERGVGKTANCIMLRRYVEDTWKNTDNFCLVGSYQIDKNVIMRDKIVLTDHVNAFLPNLVENMYEFICKSKDSNVIDNAIKLYGKFLARFIKKYTKRFNEFELTEQIYTIMKWANTDQKQMICQTILNRDEVGFVEALETCPEYIPYVSRIFNLYKLIQKTNESLADNNLDTLEQFATISQYFGIQHAFILIDKVDQKGANLKQIALMLESLLAEDHLFDEMPFYSFKFFLPTQLEKELKQLGVRFDRFLYRHIQWEDKDLEKLLNSRMEFYTDSKIPGYSERCDFRRIFEESIRWKVIEIMIKQCKGVPRELLRFGDIVLALHRGMSNYVEVYISEATLDKALGEQVKISDIESKVEALSFERLIFICFDFFLECYQKLKVDSDKEDLIESLLKVCQEQNKVGFLWTLLVIK